ncbi:MAG: DUF1501 domain-containing protein [Thermoleophilia bacterium]|nr:DUF1501 domain-containing protein [Thermoleophilia bacterium]
MDRKDLHTDHDAEHVVDPGFAEAVICADCARSDSAALDVEPVDHMPIPIEAINGFEDGVPRVKRHDRRSFITNGALGMAAVYGASKIDWTEAFEAAKAEAAEPGSVLVCLYLNGGFDGMQNFVPIANPDFGHYSTARPNVGRALGASAANQVGTTVMPGTGGQFGFANVGVSGVGNNEQTVGFDTIWGNGSGAGADMALWPAVNFFQNSSRSHFDSRDYWFRGTTDDETETGWLGRWLDLYGSKANPLQAISLSSNLSKQIRTKRAPVSAVRNLNGVEFSVSNSGETDATEVMGSVSSVKAAKKNEQLNHAREAYNRTVRVARSLKTLENAPAGAGYPQSSLSTRLQLAATLIGAGLGTRIVTIDWGSFDNHANILNSMDPQLTTLSHALAAFRADLVARGVETKVITLIFTEFGRRVEQNDNGTDHGTAGPMMLMGSRVNGGLAGDWPGIAPGQRARRGDDLRAANDPRQIYAQVISEWLGGDANAVLPGRPAATARPIIG